MSIAMLQINQWNTSCNIILCLKIISNIKEDIKTVAVDLAYGFKTFTGRTSGAIDVMKGKPIYGEPIDDTKIYKIGLQYYFYLNMKDFFFVSHEEVEQNGKPRMIATSCREVFDEYLSCRQGLDHQISGRLKFE